MSCYNRREATLKCLDSIYRQIDSPDYRFNIFLVDDGSTDGTAALVTHRYPEVKIISGDGSLFWNGGMRLAWLKARQVNHDFYLWVNDDAVLKPDAFAVLMKTHQNILLHSHRHALIVGAMIDPHSGRQTYGGLIKEKSRFSLRFMLLPIQDTAQRCDTLNGNCVLVPLAVVEKVGILSSDFRHALGDYDYGLRACAAGFGCWVAPGILGECSRNASTGAWFDPNLPFRERRQAIAHPKGRPVLEWLTFVGRHAGATVMVIAWIKLELSLLFPSLWKRLRLLRGRDD